MSTTASDLQNQPAEPYTGPIGELERLQTEIDDDLTAGRISPEAYQSANERIAIALRAVTAPLLAAPTINRNVRVVGIPRERGAGQKGPAID